MSERQNRAVEQAIEHVDGHINAMLVRAFAAVEAKKNHQEGCMCPSCQKMVVSELNSWLDFDDPDGKLPRAEYDGKEITLR